MDMMKDMYEEGDENMKKIIGQNYDPLLYCIYILLLTHTVHTLHTCI